MMSVPNETYRFSTNNEINKFGKKADYLMQNNRFTNCKWEKKKGSTNHFTFFIMQMALAL